MSDTMLLGVLRMPFESAMATPTARIQYYRRGVQAADEIEKMRAEVERLREALEFYAHQYCELGEAFAGCGKLPGDQCGGCLARAALAGGEK